MHGRGEGSGAPHRFESQSVKARQISLGEVPSVNAAIQRVIGVRFAEVLSLAPALDSKESQELHSLRIACKRLRYSLELFSKELPTLKAAAQRFTQLQDELGSLHDCDVLLGLAQQHGASRVQHRVRRDRERHFLRAKALWLDAFTQGGPFAPLVAYTGLNTVQV
ncbi:MAG: CHAD domain-containing protein [Candidatus Eremiobacteraeota bacterium]|nr:CHAD domain-containing protein [Candidatus Eremiobacteraeota bacterium]